MSADLMLSTVWISPQQAKASLEGQVGPYCRQLWALGHERLSVLIQPEEDAKTVQQGKFYWGVVLKEISEQAVVCGERWSAEAWHELFKRQFLPRVRKVTRIAGKKRPVVTTTIGTTKGIGIRKMSKHIEQCLAYGTVDLGVQFSLTRWEEYRA